MFAYTEGRAALPVGDKDTADTGHHLP